MEEDRGYRPHPNKRALDSNSDSDGKEEGKGKWPYPYNWLLDSKSGADGMNGSGDNQKH